MSQVKDVAIIGMGPAGVTAAIYLKRFGYEPVCYEPLLVGGKVNLTYEIQNYPGFMGEGPNLADSFVKQLEFYDIKPLRQKVLSIESVDGLFLVTTDDEKVLYRSVIVATGMVEKPYVVPNQEEYQGRGISRCATCDGPLYRNKDVGVIGGGNSAFEEALYLATICKSVTLINRRDEFRADARLVEELKNTPNAKILTPYVVSSSNGTNKIESLTIANVSDNSEMTIPLEALFVYVGADPSTKFLPSGVLDSKGYIVTNREMETSIKGLFGAGDCRDTHLRQVATAVSDGALSALGVKNYLKTTK